LLEKLNSELNNKEKALTVQKELVALKQNEVRDLVSQIEIMSSKMSTLVQLTKSTQETERKVHEDHILELQNLKKRTSKF